TPSGIQLPFNLIDANLSDGKTMIDRTDFEQVRSALGSQLLIGDANFDGTIDSVDLTVVLQNFGVATPRWGLGNFENDSTVDSLDLTDVLQHFGLNAGGMTLPADAALLNDPLAVKELAAYGITVAAAPEPSAIGLLAIGAVGLVRRRRRF
ncbi:MAG TPA: PEP-CTERM sorting domain-containing protein, partial [Bryobacteraceae bacterium]|nr:PEP-CTERM sorting domain-containing protein [Bryobacteraceae bacterium]